MSSSKNMSEEQILEFYEIFYNYYLKIKQTSNKHKIKIRLPNFQEGLSENMVRLFIKNHEKRNCECAKIGDLQVIENIKNENKEELIINTKIEVKCFSSTGPTSFGPSESWDEIYFLDACDFPNNKFKIYKCNLSNNSKEWSNIMINKNKNYLTVCKEGKRPRLGFNMIKSQLKDNIKLVFDGNFNDMISQINTIDSTNIKNNKEDQAKVKPEKKPLKKENNVENNIDL